MSTLSIVIHFTDWCRYIGQKRLIDQRSSAIKPPHTIARPPRSRIHWKGFKSVYKYGVTIATLILATECRATILPLHYTEFYQTSILIVSKAVRILLGDSITFSECEIAERLLRLDCITFSECEIAERLLRLFWKLNEECYGMHTCTYIHNL